METKKGRDVQVGYCGIRINNDREVWNENTGRLGNRLGQEIREHEQILRGDWSMKNSN